MNSANGKLNSSIRWNSCYLFKYIRELIPRWHPLFLDFSSDTILLTLLPGRLALPNELKFLLVWDSEIYFLVPIVNHCMLLTELSYA